ncbi:hypothetical protein WBJ53_25040 [Spirosoma sp. SC4-14]|uniref:hypothetical protein n=1 Tax=Spirosoma sp. SC4-14 TaxID=3128900 RepID=UPI0030CE0AD4
MTTEHPTKQHSKMSWYQNPAVLYSVIVLLLAGVVYLIVQNWQLEHKTSQERSILHTKVRQNQLANDRQQLTLTMKAFVWAVRNAMLQNKTGEINEYFNTLVKNRGVKEVLLVDSAGKIMISTNKKNQDMPFTNRFPAYLLQKQDIYFNNKMPYELSAPVTAPNKRLGTLVMFYTPATILPDSLAISTASKSQ